AHDLLALTAAPGLEPGGGYHRLGTRRPVAARHHHVAGDGVAVVVVDVRTAAARPVVGQRQAADGAGVAAAVVRGRPGSDRGEDVAGGDEVPRALVEVHTEVAV